MGFGQKVTKVLNPIYQSFCFLFRKEGSENEFFITMSAEDIACCLSCHMTFGSHEELFVHTCAQIKVEVVEAEDSKQLNSIVQEDFRNEIDPIKVSENDSDYSPKKKKQKKPNTKKKVTKQQKNGEKLMTKEGKKKKVQVKREKFDEDFKVLEENYFENKEQFQWEESSNLELSEEFITLILNTVDELCENIKIGDPNIQRTLEVNKNLNDAVNCYRSKLDTEKQIKGKSKNHEDYDYEGANFESDDNFDPASKKPKGKKRRVGRPIEPKQDKKFEFIRNQCGSHSITSMSLMLRMSTNAIDARIKKEGIDFSKKPKPNGTQCEDCYFCQMKKDNENVNPSLLFPFVKYNKEEGNKKAFQCTICSFHGRTRAKMFTHIASIHKNEIYAEASNNSKLEEKYDCGEGTCKKMYYKAEEKKYWCKKCFRISQTTKAEKPKPEKKPIVIKQKLCPECGASTTSLSKHLNRHHGEKQTCSYCGQKYAGIESLKSHINIVHEKIPCTQCGKLVGIARMNRHIASVHTPNDQKKYQCDVCSKGFSSLQHLRDHRNLHTGEKPYKCQFCPSCFASAGNHASHEKGHLGYKRGAKT